MGGLAAAIDLAGQGLRVTLVERARAPGGKMRQVFADGRPIDAGPTVFTMRWVFESLFADAGQSLSDHLTLRPATTLARHAWAGSPLLDLFADRRRSAEAIAAFAGPKDGAGYLAFCEQAARIYRTLEGPFIKSARPSAAGLVQSTGVLNALRLMPFHTLWSAVGTHLTDPRLRQLFGRYSTYCGTSPYLAPATLMLVAHVEQEGVWLVDGGMHQVAQALARVAAGLGVDLRYGTHVADLTLAAGRASGVRLADGETIAADAVVLNGEPTALAAGLLGPNAKAAAQAVPFPQRSLSAVTLAGVAETGGLPLLRHTVLFSGDYKREFDDIAAARLPAEPTTYICAQDRTDQDAPPATAPERLLILVNAPATGDGQAFSQQEIERCTNAMTGLTQRCGLRIRFTEPPIQTAPAEFNRLFPASAGALYGPAVNGGMASFKRPLSRTKLPGLYLAGGSTHPGAGVPMAALSGRQAALSVVQDLAPRASTRPSPRTATPGGMSTR